ncbi:uncharacterized protein LOC123876083 [Maniola jurtina]|uniref:uncharacterized protein LOC123876083 n=1 Tax=Maniola jurtina TaxID=191418 RepID=UPI001E68F802|nr:uncharacterized protein LOC123876083 [Maniola jurtina]
MACFPIILLIAGLQKHDVITNVLAGTLKNMVENCKSIYNDESDSYFPRPLPEYGSTKFPYCHHGKFEEVKYDDSNIKYGDDTKFDMTPLSLSSDKSNKCNMKAVVPKYPVKATPKTLGTEEDKNIYDADKYSLLRKRITVKKITIPTVDSRSILIKVFDNANSLVAVSNNLLQKIFNVKDEDDFLTDPFFSKLTSGTSVSGNKNISFLGVPTKHLANLIIETYKNLRDSGSKQLKKFLKQNKDLIEAASKFLEEQSLEVYNFNTKGKTGFIYELFWK